MPILPDIHITIAATARLAHSLRRQHARQQLDAGLRQWQPLAVYTLNDWLTECVNNAMLLGRIPVEAAPAMVLDGLAERLLWEQAITPFLRRDPRDALFDHQAIAQTAKEAHQRLIEWQVDMDAELGKRAFLSSETQQFLQWRERFERLCAEKRLLDTNRYLEWVLEWLPMLDLPETLTLAGYDRKTRLEEKLEQALTSLGVTIEPARLVLENATTPQVHALEDADQECRAAVAWAAAKLRQHPQLRLAIVSPQLDETRDMLAALLDDAMQPETLNAAAYELDRVYDFSIGVALHKMPLIATALQLLGLAAHPRNTAQSNLSALLQNPYWTAGATEADARALLDAQLRRHLPATLDLHVFADFVVGYATQSAAQLPQLVAHLQALTQAAQSWRGQRKHLMAWLQDFQTLLATLNWAQTRPLSSWEYQMQQAWQRIMQRMGSMGALLGNINAAEALQRMAQHCRESIFQPEAAMPQIQVLGMLETLSAPVDALWIMGMNDHLWPPPARHNALLPAQLQRKYLMPNASPLVQKDFAQNIFSRWMHSAPDITISYARHAKEEELRPSPLLSAYPLAASAPETMQPRIVQWAQPEALVALEDSMAPPVTPAEKVRGGSGLLKAQAICPAWAFYQYRLGAQALDSPTDGLDNLDRGTLVHAVLECFWRNTKSQAALRKMTETQRDQAIAEAVHAGIAAFCESQQRLLSAHFIALESKRLAALLHQWLPLELAREPFEVIDCERRVTIDVAGLEVRLSLDRLDTLSDGHHVVLDYKTGGTPKLGEWAKQRITEPQLPLYATLALDEAPVAAVCFAKVRAGELAFSGIAQVADLLPDVKTLDKTNAFKNLQLVDWQALMAAWRQRLSAIALEVMQGQAAVRFEDENDLQYCEVKPLLRLAERDWQFEQLPQTEPPQ